VDEVCPEAEEKKTVEAQSASCTPPSVEADTEEASISSDTPHEASALAEARQPEENIHSWIHERLHQPMDDSSPGLWRKILNLVLGK
jgi:hypothetical protein